MYRLRPALNLSGKFLYGSGFPIPSGTFVQISNGQYVEVGINTTPRLARITGWIPGGQRLGLQALEADAVWRGTESDQSLQRAGTAYSSGVDPNTGQVQIKTLQGLPITPTVGLAFQF